MIGFGLAQLWRILTVTADSSMFVPMVALVGIGAVTAVAVRAGGGR